MGLLSVIGTAAGAFFGGPAGAAVGGSIGGAIENGKSAKEASQVQSNAAQSGIDETRRLLAPYNEAGNAALNEQKTFLGMNGADAERAAIERIISGSTYKDMVAQGENAILQNASATGSLRGGNVQGALAQFRPALLSQLISQQYERLGGLTGLGQLSALGQARIVPGLQGQQGQAEAGGILGETGALTGGLAKSGGLLQGLGGSGGFGNIFKGFGGFGNSFGSSSSGSPAFTSGGLESDVSVGGSSGIF